LYNLTDSVVKWIITKFTSALDGGERSASRPCLLYPRYPYDRRLFMPHCQEPNPDPSLRCQVTVLLNRDPYGQHRVSVHILHEKEEGISFLSFFFF
jgi:hypothetical protein